MTKKPKPYVNSQGAAYFAVNFLGWATAKTPWEALAKLDLNMSGKKPTLGSKSYDVQTNGVNLYYLPNESLFTGTNRYAPINEQGGQYGVPIFLGLSEHSEQVIKMTLETLEPLS